MRSALAQALALPPGQLGAFDNPGLALDCYLPRAGDPKERKDLYKRIAGSAPPAIYAQRYERWRAALQGQPHTRLAIFKVSGRLIVGLGNESVHETGLTLQHVDGTPYIPGSALKGLANHYTAQHLGSSSLELKEGGEYHHVLFGTTDEAGYVTYFDAWYVPGSAPEDRPLALDTITVHHPKYYTGHNRRAPWDLDDPNPVPFLSVRGRFLVAVAAASMEWAEFALAVLKQALADWGAGAKTSSGYGRLEWIEDLAAGSPAPARAEQLAIPSVHPLISEIQSIPAGRLRQEIGSFIQRATRLDDPARDAVLYAVANRLQANPALWRWARDRPWFAQIATHVAKPGE